MRFGLLSVALRNLKRRSFRTSVLVMSIGLLVAILVFGSSFIISVPMSLKRASDRLGADLLVVPVGARDYAEEVLLETKAKSFYMGKNMIEKVKAVDGIEAVTHHTYLTTIIGICCDVPEAKVVAFNEETDFIVQPWLKKAIGRKLERGEAIIGREAYENFGLLDVKSSRLFGSDFRIVGVMEKTGTGLDNAIFISDENIGEIIEKGKSSLRPDQISLIFTRVKPGYDPYMVGRKVEGEIIDVDVIPRSDMGKNIMSVLKDINRVFIITIVLATVLSVFLTWTIFSAIVNERTREIGIMRAIGAKDSHVVRLFVLEVMLLGVIGSFFGIALGTYLSISLSRIFALLRDVSATLTLSERIEIALMGLAIGISVCVIGALSPMLRIRNLEPHSALKEV